MGASWERSAALDWLGRFASAVESKQIADITALFGLECWWRDLLALTWDFRTAQGPERIAALLQEGLEPSGLGSIEPYDRWGPSLVEAGDTTWLELIFRFETRVGRGRGVARLVPGSDDETWRAWIVTTVLEELEGHEERTGRHRPRGEAHRADRERVTWLERREQEGVRAVAAPEVLVVGAGHSGLGVAARLRQLDVPTLVVDRNPRVGDNWRNRYRSLVLHDPVHTEHLPYLPFPSTWPTFCPKDKLADWLEAYATVMELDVRTSSELVGASYDEREGRWTARIANAGKETVVRPRHIVMATGLAGPPAFPDLPGRERYEGSLIHSSSYVDGRLFAGKSALVVGACNSGLDVARDLWECGADVTVLQRSSTYLFSIWTGVPLLYERLYGDNSPPLEDADLLRYMPNLAGLDLARELTRRIAALDRDLLEGLERAGFRTNLGEGGAGMRLTALRRAGGYAIDVGCAALIAGGEIAVKQGVEIERLEPDGPVFTDGSSIRVDAIVLATGFLNMREAARRILGDEVADRCKPVWGLDDEGELSGLYRPTGHPGLWFASHGLSDSRFLSRLLALGLKARLEGISAPLPVPAAGAMRA
jgi:putative flavoprotein involved in K+ transport